MDALLKVIHRILSNNIPTKTANFLASSSLIVWLLKESPAEVLRMRIRAMEAARAGHPTDFKLPIRPIAVGSVLTRMANLLALIISMEDVIASAVGPRQH